VHRLAKFRAEVLAKPVDANLAASSIGRQFSPSPEDVQLLAFGKVPAALAAVIGERF
jgi:hypothetical protein